MRQQKIVEPGVEQNVSHLPVVTREHPDHHHGLHFDFLHVRVLQNIEKNIIKAIFEQKTFLRTFAGMRA
jgi:hypothetical protein